MQTWTNKIQIRNSLERLLIRRNFIRVQNFDGGTTALLVKLTYNSER